MAAMLHTKGGKRLLGPASALVALGVVVATLVGGPPPARAAQAPLVGPLAVSGTSLVDLGQGGKVVTLRGVGVLADTSGPYPGGLVDANAVSTLVGWGANFVRLGISADQYVQGCPDEQYDTNYRTQLAQAVQALTSHGIYTLLDIHTSDPDCLWSSGQTSASVPLPGPDTAEALSGLVAQFGANPLVGYEPFNEPQACAESTGGPGATQFVPIASEPGYRCPTQAQGQLAWNGSGTVYTTAVSLLGVPVGVQGYSAPGMASLYETIMHSVPAGAPTPLVFLDANGWAASGSTFDDMASQLAGASNIVQVFHPYDCQDTSSAVSDGHQSARCLETDPEACSTTSSAVRSYMSDPATGGPWSRPVVFDEFNFPAGEDSYYVNGPLGVQVPVLVYQHGYWVNNMIAAMQGDGAAGWSLFFLQNADVDNYVTPYSMVVPGIDASTPTPWTPNANAAPAVAAMGGATLSCEAPPPGFG
jgi:hypothetical protein